MTLIKSSRLVGSESVSARLTYTGFIRYAFKGFTSQAIFCDKNPGAVDEFVGRSLYLIPAPQFPPRLFYDGFKIPYNVRCINACAQFESFNVQVGIP
ncbi:MAG TPA: hypothetical protein VD816_07825, partial [Ohtaekwangia sp.]|nr:hypothetical protein [Ohtaekwangia sp.]